MPCLLVICAENRPPGTHALIDLAGPKSRAHWRWPTKSLQKAFMQKQVKTISGLMRHSIAYGDLFLERVVVIGMAIQSSTHWRHHKAQLRQRREDRLIDVATGHRRRERQTFCINFTVKSHARSFFLCAGKAPSFQKSVDRRCVSMSIERSDCSIR